MQRLNADTALQVLLELTEKLADDLPLEEFLGAVTSAALELVPVNHASIRLLDGARESLLSSARAGTGTEQAPQDFRRGEGVLGWVVENKQSAFIHDVAQDARFTPAPQPSWPIGSMIAEPLWSGDDVIGVLSVTAAEAARFSERDQLLIRLLANCSAPAIERARLKHLAMFDHLTQALSHRGLYSRITEEMLTSRRLEQPLSLLLLDLDHFKSVNDTHGHSAGDATLRLVADRVRGAIRRVDALVRRGGEEFVVIMPDTDLEQAQITAERLRQRLCAEPLQLDASLCIQQTVSIGVATWDGHENAEQLEERADAAMYQAKRAGRDRVMVSTHPPPADWTPPVSDRGIDR